MPYLKVARSQEMRKLPKIHLRTARAQRGIILAMKRQKSGGKLALNARTEHGLGVQLQLSTHFLAFGRQSHSSLGSDCPQMDFGWSAYFLASCYLEVRYLMFSHFLIKLLGTLLLFVLITTVLFASTVFPYSY